MEPTLDVEGFLKTANFDLKIELEYYKQVVSQLRLDVSNIELREKRQQLEEKIIIIGQKEKAYFNEMRKHPEIYNHVLKVPSDSGSSTQKENGFSMNELQSEADSGDKCLETDGRSILKKTKPNGNGNKKKPAKKSVGNKEHPQDPIVIAKTENQTEANTSVKNEKVSQVKTNVKKKKNSSQAKADNPSETNASTKCAMEKNKVDLAEMQSLNLPEEQFPLRYDMGSAGDNPYAGHPSETMKKEDFLRLFNLVPTSTVANLRKRRAERKKRSTEDSQFVYENSVATTEDVSPGSSDKACVPTPKKKTHRGRPKRKSIMQLAIPATIYEEASQAGSECSSGKKSASGNMRNECVEVTLVDFQAGWERLTKISTGNKQKKVHVAASQAGSECSSDKSCGNVQKEVHVANVVEAPTNDVLVAVESASCDASPPDVPPQDLPQYVVGFIKHAPGPSGDNPDGLSVMLYEPGSRGPDVALGSGATHGRSTAVTITNVAQCKSCLNNFPVLGDHTSDFKCVKCTAGRPPGTEPEAPGDPSETPSLADEH